LSYGLWEQRYGSDPNILKRVIKVNGKSFDIVGVMKKGFDFPMPAEAWIPLALNVKERLGATIAGSGCWDGLSRAFLFPRAAAEMQAISERQAEAYPDTNKAWRLRPQPLGQFITGTLTRQYTVLLMVAVGFVLLIACRGRCDVQFRAHHGPNGVSSRCARAAGPAAAGGSFANC